MTEVNETNRNPRAFMSFQEKIIEGKYNYFHKNQVYCEEFFKVFRQEKSYGNFTFNAELMSRVETGEFLKVFVDYELNHHFEPLNVRIKRSLGASKSSERFVVDLQNKQVHYVFKGKNGIEEFEKAFSGKFHIATPAFSTSMLMTQARKIDPVHRTSYDVISSNNVWEYEEPLVETNVYVELMSLEPVSINLQGNELQASYCKIFEEDKTSNPNSSGHPVYLSKHYQIPYQAEFPNDMKIEVEKLRNFQSEYGKLF